MNLIADIAPATVWTGVVAVIGTITAWLTTRNRDRADVTAVLSETSLEWIHELRAEADRLADELDEARAEADHHRLDAQFLRHRVIAYEARLREAGIDPAETGRPYSDP